MRVGLFPWYARITYLFHGIFIFLSFPVLVGCSVLSLRIYLHGSFILLLGGGGEEKGLGIRAKVEVTVLSNLKLYTEK